jgi:hypothetical protein
MVSSLGNGGRELADLASRGASTRWEAPPERIHQARRIAVRNGLTDYGMPLSERPRAGATNGRSRLSAHPTERKIAPDGCSV